MERASQDQGPVQQMIVAFTSCFPRFWSVMVALSLYGMSQKDEPPLPSEDRYQSWSWGAPTPIPARSPSGAQMQGSPSNVALTIVDRSPCEISAASILTLAIRT